MCLVIIITGAVSKVRGWCVMRACLGEESAAATTTNTLRINACCTYQYPEVLFTDQFPKLFKGTSQPEGKKEGRSVLALPRGRLEQRGLLQLLWLVGTT
jgi:hypothetical protein